MRQELADKEQDSWLKRAKRGGWRKQDEMVVQNDLKVLKLDWAFKKYEKCIPQNFSLLSPESLTPVNSLSLVLLTPVINFHSVFLIKFGKGPNEILRGPGDTDSWKNRKSKISYQAPFKKTQTKDFWWNVLPSSEANEKCARKLQTFSLDKLFVCKHVICNNLTSADTVKWYS